MDCTNIPYHVDIERIIKSIVENKASRVVLQLPDGLKQYGVFITECIREGVGLDVDIYVHSDSVYGGCDIQYGQLWATIKPDLIVHIGHSPYPLELAHEYVEPPASLRVKIIYVPALSKLDINSDVVLGAIELLRRYDAKIIGLVTTAQHTHKIKSISEILEKNGFKPITPRGSPPYFLDGQVIGCDYRLARSIKADIFIYLGGGVFHPVGLYLATFKPVIKIDPYEGKSTDITPLGEKIYKSRLYKIMESFSVERWAIIVGVKTGQYRPWLVRRLREEIESRGRKYTLISSENLTLQNLLSIDNQWIQAFTITSCPRIPTDDYWDYHKPVLTPGEAFMALRGELEPYRFPW
ncbi:MAG: diphthamide biosynthesis enzyme Dph2 [Acidilobaceae archaeon]